MSSAPVARANRWEAIRLELHVEHAQVLSARRHVDLEQTFHRHAEHLGVEVVGQVVHPLDERDDLPVLLVLAALLDPGVDVADDRLDVAHHLALEGGEQPQHAVGGRVVRADVDREQLFVEVALDQRLGAGDGLLAHPLHRHRALALAIRRGAPPRSPRRLDRARQSYQRGYLSSLNV